MNLGSELKAGDSELSAQAFNNMRRAAQIVFDGLGKSEKPQYSYSNPLIISVENASGSSLPPFSAVEISAPMYNRTGEVWETGALNYGVEMKVVTPTAADGKNLAVLLQGLAAGTLGKAVVSGPVSCRVLVESAAEAEYQYAHPVYGQTYLKASESGPIRILGKESGVGTLWGYVLLDSQGVSDAYLAYTPAYRANADASFQPPTRTFYVMYWVNV